MDADVFTFNGINVYCNDLCVEVIVRWVPQQSPIRKRRRNWRVIRVEERKPCAWQTPQGIFAHPTLYKQLKQLAGT